MLSESEKEKLKNFMLTQGTGPLSVEFRESRGELENFQKRLENLQNSQVRDNNLNKISFLVDFRVKRIKCTSSTTH